MKTIHVDDFIALNDEIRALTFAGIPLPEGLRAASSEYPGRVGTAANAIASRLESGERLEEALVEECGIDPVYSVVISAGIRSGRLTQALEGVASTLQRISSLRRLILVSLAYPALLTAMAYGLFVFLLGNRNLFVGDLYGQFSLGTSPFAFYTTMKETLPYWVWIPPVAFFFIIAWVVWTVGRGGTAPGMKLPIIGPLIRYGRIAAFLELLGLLVEHETPLDEACELSARASADGGIQASGRQLAAKLREGVQTAAASGNLIPPMIQWLILSGADDATLRSNLRRSADAYNRRTERLGSWMSVYIPLLASLLIGGGATALFALFVLGPWFHFLLRLGVSV